MKNDNELLEALRHLTDAVAAVAVFPMKDEIKIAEPLARARAAIAKAEGTLTPR